MKGSGNGWKSRGCCRLYLLFKTNQLHSHIAFFPQMRPLESQKEKVQSKKEEYIEFGIPEEWIPVLQELGYTTVEKLKKVENV